MPRTYLQALPELRFPAWTYLPVIFLFHGAFKCHKYRDNNMPDCALTRVKNTQEHAEQNTEDQLQTCVIQNRKSK